MIDKLTDHLTSFPKPGLEGLQGVYNIDPDDASRIKWDSRYLDAARLYASWSKDPSTQCGAVIVRPDRGFAGKIVGEGFNGFPKRCNDGPEVYADRPLKYARVVHAEMNALLNAAQPLHGCTLYTWPPNVGPSCDRCSAHIIQAGITRVVFKMDNDKLKGGFSDRWGESIKRGLDMYEEAGVEVIYY